MISSKKIKYFTGMIVLIMLVFVFELNSFSQFESKAGSAILLEASTGKVLYEKNADIPLPPASITKVMTLLIGLEALDQGTVKWDDLVSVSEKAWRMEGSKMFLHVGDKVKFGDIMTGISVVSANDGCVALAEHLYGSEEAFVHVMNKRAREIGMTNSNFRNSSGMPSEGHVMSARDIAILANYIIKNHPRILELESQREFTYNNIRQFNRNPLLGNFEGADGLKTGWTNEAGYCLVGTAEQDGVRMISVVLNTENERERSAASQELLTYGFRNFKIIDIMTSGEIVDVINVRNGNEQTVAVKVDSTITALVPVTREKDIEIILTKDIDTIIAPVFKDTKIGKLEILLDNEVLASSEISTSEEVQRIGFFRIIGRSIANFLRFFSK